MADAVNVGFARSEQLRKEWATLKREILAIEPDTPDAASRRNAIHNRMDQVMTDMTTVLAETRRLIPTPQLDMHDPEIPTPPADRPLQYSARKLHVIRRTYDSSSDDSDFETFQSFNQNNEAEFNDDIDVHSLRQDMMNDANPNDIVTVEGKGLRASIHIIKEKLRRPDTHKPKSEEKTKNGLPPPSPRGKPLSTDDREDLALEQSRLERESRRLKRKPERTVDDDSRLEDIANRLSRISSTLADTADSQSPQPTPLTSPAKSPNPFSNNKGIFSQKPPRLERSAPLSPLGENDEEFTFDSAEGETPSSLRGSQKPLSTKRKKGWMALEAGVASFRAFGRTIRQTATTAPKEQQPESVSGPSNTGKEKKPFSPPSTKGGNVFANAAEGLQQRGERLNNVANDAEEMNNDAGDMLAAVRALRQRNQKSGFFS